ncbi:hypothetical protein KGO95_02435 [Patescibacteria group bacterium]|nr:hypothetical protein [Patescibacteria group bacterium]
MRTITVHTTFFCAECKARLPENIKTCHKAAPFILAAVTNYDEAVKSSVHQFKYRRWTSVMSVFAPLIETYLDRCGLHESDALIVPIPLHPSRLRDRGFNQAALIARVVAHKLGAPLRPELLKRVRQTHAQAELTDWQARAENLANAFSVPDGVSFENKSIILVDDVYTSGATMRDAARALRAAGARKIIAFVVAKTG